MKKLILDIEIDEESILFGLLSDEKILRLAWLINNTGICDFSRSEDILLENNDQKIKNAFSKFDYEDLENHLYFSLFSNIDGNRTLFPELKNMNYLIFISGGLEFFDKNNFVKTIKSIKPVRLLSEIEQSKLKSKMNLIL